MNCLTLLQVKFSELTIDMFRMLQALEREPMNLASQMNKPGMQVCSVPVSRLGFVVCVGLNAVLVQYSPCAQQVSKAAVILTRS